MSDKNFVQRSDEELQKFVVGELKPHDSQITLVEYDADWPNLFEREARRICSALGNKALQIEHVGSTSVPGLCAKPIIDMLLVVKDSADESSYVPVLEAADMCYRFENLTGLSIVCLKDRIPISICMCSVRAHQRLIECYALEIGYGPTKRIGRNMRK